MAKTYTRKHTNKIAFKKHMDGLKKRRAIIDKVSGMLYPKLIRYDGSWGVLIKGSERGLFTATLYDLSLK